MPLSDSPPPRDGDIADLRADLRSLEYPVTRGAVVAIHGQRWLTAGGNPERLADVLRRVDDRRFDSAEELLATVEAALDA